MKNFLKSFLFFFILFFITEFLDAQTLNLQSTPADKTQFGFKFQKAFYNSDMNMSALSGAYELSINIPVSSGLNVFGIIPYMNNSFEFNYYYSNVSVQNDGIGNIFIALQTRPSSINNQNSFFTFGVFLPTASDDAADFGTDYYNLLKFLPDALGFYINYAFHKVNEEGFIYALEAGPDVLIPTSDNGAEGEFFFHYGASAGFKANNLALNVELLGIGIITQDFDDFTDRFNHQFGPGVQWSNNRFTAKLSYRIFLKDELQRMVDGVLGLGFTVTLD